MVYFKPIGQRYLQSNCILICYDTVCTSSWRQTTTFFPEFVSKLPSPGLVLVCLVFCIERCLPSRDFRLGTNLLPISIAFIAVRKHFKHEVNVPVQAKKTSGGWRCSSFLTRAPDGSDWSASLTDRYAAGRRVPSNYWAYSCVGPTASLDVSETEKPAFSIREPNRSPSVNERLV